MKKNLKRLLGGVTLFLIGLIILLSPRFSVASFLVDTSNTLRTNLISYWNLNEASSTRIDSYGTNNLAVRGTGGVAAGAGKISNAADFELSEGDFLEITDNASLSTGDVDFSISAWVKLESKTTASIVTRYESGTVREYWLGYDATADRFQMYLYNSTGVNVGIATANNSGSPSTGTWYHVVAWHDSVNNTINIKVNNGTKIQVRVVHIIINLKVRVILPIAFKVFVKGVVIAARAEVSVKTERANNAGLHFEYFGIISTKIGAKSINITKVGKTKRQIKKMDLVTKSERSFLLSCNLENAGKVTFIT